MPTGYEMELGKLEAWVVKNSSWLAMGVIAAAFAIRLAYAACCYLNPDEAAHFASARPSSWLGAYQGSWGQTHPPLFILVLHGMLVLGRTEQILRLPSLVSGTVALWVTFAWIRRSIGEIPAMAGLGFMSFSHGAISASTEVRQYGLLLFFVCVCLYSTERALSDHSVFWAIVQGLSLIGALLTHYTAIIVIVSIALYIFLRRLLDDIPRRIFFTISASYALLAILVGWLYFGHVRGVIPFGSGASMEYLRGYYYRAGSETPSGFAWRVLSATFAYAVGARRSGLLAMLVFLAGLVGLLLGRTKAQKLMALLVITPFVVGFTAEVAQVFPFAGSRHQTYLLPFLAAGIAAAFAWLHRRVAAPVLLLLAAIAPVWLLTHTAPDNDCRVQSIGDMTSAIEIVSRMIPNRATLFVDEETRNVLSYYLTRNDKSLDTWPPHWGGTLRDAEGRSGGYCFVVPRKDLWAFRPEQALEQVNESAQALGVPSGEPLWIVSVAWLEPSLASRIPPGQNRDIWEFGRISIIKAPQSQSATDRL
jgi:hypothetical protein